MTREIRRRIIQEATPEERVRHRIIRAEIEQDLPELKQWARETAARHNKRMAGPRLRGHGGPGGQAHVFGGMPLRDESARRSGPAGDCPAPADDR
jgi:hypothetical protein